MTQINLYKDELRSYKKKLESTQSELKIEKEQMSDDVLEKVDEVGEKPLLGAVKQMYQIQGLSEDAAVGIKEQNVKLMKNIERMTDIGTDGMIQMAT